MQSCICVRIKRLGTLWEFYFPQIICALVSWCSECVQSSSHTCMCQVIRGEQCVIPRLKVVLKTTHMTHFPTMTVPAANLNQCVCLSEFVCVRSSMWSLWSFDHVLGRPDLFPSGATWFRRAELNKKTLLALRPEWRFQQQARQH